MKILFFTVLGMFSLGQVQAVQQASDSKEKHAFHYDDVFSSSEKITNVSDLSQKVPEKDVSMIVPEKAPINSNIGPMLIINEGVEQISVNEKVLNNNLFKDCLQLVEYLYFGTKRYAQSKRVFDDAFRVGPQKPPLYEVLKNKNITISSEIFGTNGGVVGTTIGMIAYRKLPQTLQLFVILEGSQGEDFEFLGGLGGASWLTNFQAKKTTTNVFETFNLDKKYLSKEDVGNLSYHEGFLEKISTSYWFFKDAIHKTLRDVLGIEDCSKINLEKQGLGLKDFMDQKRGFTVQVYILGHSQGGGLVQVAAPYYTNYIGQYLYGKSFDNAVFNTIHAICLSPARAIGDKHTLEVIERVMGRGNIFGYCSPMDPVPCVPFGSNIDGHKLKGVGFTVLRKLAKIVSHFVNKELSRLLDAVGSVNCHYEDLPIFAYEDYNAVLNRYAELSLESLKNLENQDSLRKGLEEILKKRDEISQRLKKTQEYYFESHQHRLWQDYYLGKSTYHLTKVFKYCAPVDFIAAQHFGTYVCLRWNDENTGAARWKVDALFNHKIFEGDVQKAIDRGIDYKKHKEKFLKK